MNPNEQRIKIAEVCGLSIVKASHGGYYTVLQKTKDHPEGYEKGSYIFQSSAIEQLPQYYSDLNAMHEAESYLSSVLDKDGSLVALYAHYLNEAVKPSGWPIWYATAKQRAEAFLRTLNLY